MNIAEQARETERAATFEASDDLAELLMSKYGVARVIKRRKPSASVPARQEVIEELSSECDVVIAGSGD